MSKEEKKKPVRKESKKKQRTEKSSTQKESKWEDFLKRHSGVKEKK